MNLVVGGTGSLGSAIARRLLAAGRPVRILTRSPERAASLAADGAEVARGDLLDRASLERACRGVDVVVAAAHSLFGRGATASAHVDDAAHRTLIDVAGAASVRHFIYTSVHDVHPAYRDIPFFRIKYEVEAHLKASGMSWTILRPTAFMEVHAHLLIGEPILRKGKTVLFGRGEQPRNFVAADDVAQVALRAFDDPALVRQTIDIGGAENPTSMDVVRLYERAAGRRAKVTHIPVALPTIISRLLRPLHPGLSQVMQAAVLGDTIDQRFDATPLEERFGMRMTRLEEWVQRKTSAGSRLALALLASLAALAVLAAGAAPVPAQAPPAQVDSIFAFIAPSGPGCAVAAIREGRVEYARGYGMADLEHDVPITPKTPFYLASVSKQFAAGAINLLVVEGKLSLDDDVRRYVPELPAFGAPITVRHLVTHTSGLRDYLTLFALRGPTDYPITNDEFLELVSRQRTLNFPTGTQYSYSNTGYVLLSIIIERVSGKSLRAFAEERIFAPLGMTSTRFRDDHSALVGGRALAYRRAAGGEYVHSLPYFDVVGDGGLFSTVEDLARWEGNFWNARVGGSRWLELGNERGRLTSGAPITYGAGLVHASHRGAAVVEHGGGLGGYSTHLMRFPAHRASVAVLCNGVPRPAGQLARQVADVFLKDVLAPAAVSDAARPPAAAAAPAAPRPALGPLEGSALAGSYTSDELGVTWSVAVRDSALLLRRRAGDTVRLEGVGGDLFRAGGGFAVRFVRDGGGRATTMMVSLGDRARDLRFERQLP